MTPEQEMQAHFDAQMQRDNARFMRDFSAIFGAEPPPPAIQKTQEGRVIRVVADESIATRDAVG